MSVSSMVAGYYSCSSLLWLGWSLSSIAVLLSVTGCSITVPEKRTRSSAGLDACDARCTPNSKLGGDSLN